MTITTRKIYVTGAAGFIGRYLLPALIERGHEVIATDVAAPAEDPGCRFETADIRDNLRHAPLVAQCDTVVHCGGISGPMLMQDNPAEVLDINIKGTLGLLSLARSFGLRRFVGLSSVSAYGTTPDMAMAGEDTPLCASNAYGTSKAAGDHLIQCYAGEYGLSAAALRVGWVYGPGRATDAILQPCVRSARGEPYAIPEGGDHRLQFVHVRDVVSAIIATVEAESLASSAYNVNGAETFTVREVVDMVKACLPDVSVEVGPGLLPGTDVQAPMDLSRAAHELGWTPQIGFAEGLAPYVDWLQEHPF
ncbi:NAD-dependent epimerase/dehydratase family protein [Marinibacterium sp. SX1]|uniref:NAD-dependent epimerase/dehydratase family protein n=1 Tax=Marinibacterium sp. SX1 TaxID=3388424 RepID=UPI003D175343